MDLLASVEQVLHTLYFDPDPGRKKAADDWLQEIYARADAWQVRELQNAGPCLALQGTG